jgi:hypothetical protein
VPVRITGPDLERLTTTDPWGEAVFERVQFTALPSLQIEVDV